MPPFFVTPIMSRLMNQPGFLIIDDHPMVLDALQATLLKAFPQSVVDAASTVRDAKALLAAPSRHDVVLVDLRMPDAEGRDALTSIKGALRKQRVIVVSATSDAGVVSHARHLGASAFIHKSASRDAIVEAVHKVLAGGESFPALPAEAPMAGPAQTREIAAPDLAARVRELTPAQLGVLKLVCGGMLNKQIAHELSIGESTVKSHITSILKKLGVHSRTQAVLVMQRIRAYTAQHDA